MSQAVVSLALITARNRELIWELTRRELMQPQANHFLGRYWVFMHPVISVLVLFAVFYFVYPTRFHEYENKYRGSFQHVGISL